MKKLLCILATAALFGACEQKTEVVAPAPPAKETPDPAKAQRLNRKTAPIAPSTTTDATTTTETKTESSTTVTATPNP
jgi:hypothetical protein